MTLNAERLAGVAEHRVDDPLPALRAEGLTLGCRPDRVVVHDLDLDLPAGAVSVIIGANGSGTHPLASPPKKKDN